MVTEVGDLWTGHYFSTFWLATKVAAIGCLDFVAKRASIFIPWSSGGDVYGPESGYRLTSPIAVFEGLRK